MKTTASTNALTTAAAVPAASAARADADTAVNGQAYGPVDSDAGTDGTGGAGGPAGPAGPTPDATVNAFFAAFGARDLAGLTALVAEDAEWNIPGDPAIVPWAGLRHGRDTLADGFFAPLFAATEPLSFEVVHAHAHTAGDASDGVTAVYVHGRFAYRFRPSQQLLDDEFVMRFTTAGGRVTSYRIFEDSLLLARVHTGDWALGLAAA
ncbi:nuclear transport factor 2 family protein [Yinghuangia seranimata]|uniref:nuclear transport factor 2 family protein n=1 Tax=Yinghuangia seranimata TaxID=408067 RepID=UPI00248D2476|nr:nuclear transport factor 2 family protein [Yinghuangia seranimata]MDI2127709.1 nuclear transport factor 2 family protein [Yinghuangia seranimata]